MYEDGAGIALLCKLDGVIQQVLRVDLPLATSAEVGKPLTTLFDEANQGKVKQFLAEVREKMAVFDWELSVPCEDQVIVLHFTGGRTEDQLLIVGATARHEVAVGFYEEMMRINNEQLNILRASLKDQAIRERERASRDQQLYLELSNLNNELINAQRELARKNAAITRERERYRATSELVSDYAYAFQVRPDGAMVREWVTEAFTRISGYALDELDAVGGWEKVVHHEDQVIYAERRQQLLDGKAHVCEFRIVNRNGSLRWLRDYARPVLDESGQRVEQILGAAQDITEQKMAAEALQESEERFRQLAETIDEVYWLADANMQRFLYIGPRYHDIWGHPVRELYEDLERFLDYVLDEDRAIMADMIRALRHHEDMNGRQQRIEYRIVRPDGEIRWLRTKLFYVHNAQGHIYRIAGTTEDITEYKQTEAQRVELAMERERIGILTNFIQDASHEFRTPLSLINLKLHLLGRIDDKERHKQLLNEIQDQSYRILSLVDGLVTMARLDSSVVHQDEHMDVNWLVRQACSSLRPQAAEGGVFLHMQLHAKPLIISGDADDMERALHNLLTNAIAYTPSGGTVTINSAYDNGCVIVEVQDTGIGIDDSDQMRIFERFYRKDYAHKTPGFGLGLPIARRIVERHGGTLDVQSQSGQGSVFTIRLPLPHLTAIH